MYSWNSVFLFISITQFSNQKSISGSASFTLIPETQSNNDNASSHLLTEIVSESRQFIDRSLCNPQPANGMAQFIIGYGSLMEIASKDRTSPRTGENIPVKILGYSREWNCKGTSISFSTTYLGALQNRQKSFVAAVYKLNDLKAGLNAYDIRESFYCREEVPLSKIQILTDKRRLSPGQYWIYVTKPEFTEEPSREYPIAQSYVDTFLSGCLELEEKFNISEFSKDCVNSTNGWEAPWINDRIFPRRPFMHQPNAGKIDKLLYEMVPKAYRNIRIE